MSFITKNQTNWKFLLIVVILAVIVDGGILWFVKQQTFQLPESKITEGVKQQNESECDKIQCQRDKDYCYNSIAISRLDLSICDKIQNQESKDECYFVLAEWEKDLSICNKIQDQDARNTCYYLVNEE